MNKPSPNILAVDDDEAVRMVLLSIPARESYEVIEAPSGKEAV